MSIEVTGPDGAIHEFPDDYLKNQLATGASTSPAVAKASTLAAALAGQRPLLTGN
jgi:hypothetical protein